MYKRNLLQSFKLAFEGIKFMFKIEKNMKVHSIIAIIVMAASFLLKISHLELLFICFSIALVMVAEAANTAFELLLDFIHGDKFHPNVKILKDIAAGGVFIAAINAILIGIIIFLPKLIKIIKL